MWIMLSNAFLSIVDKTASPSCLVVRARRPGDIERVFPDAEVKRTSGNDYLFRAEIPREAVAQALAEQVRRINYSNFKGSTKDRGLHDAYTSVWEVMADLQEVPPYSDAS